MAPSQSEVTRWCDVRRASYWVVLSLFLLGLQQGCTTEQKKAGERTSSRAIPVLSLSKIPLVLIPKGEFLMGSDEGPPNEGPAHKVIVDAYAIDQFEVTQKQFAAIEMPDPSQFKSNDRPVEQIWWINAAEYCNARSEAEGLEPCYDELDFKCNFAASGYRLPTEAEWEYAARAGGQDDSILAASAGNKIGSFACYAGNSTQKTELVGKKKPNAWGIHEMLGNVSEWCEDVYLPDYYQNSPTKNPCAGGEGGKRVIRGGSWKSPAKDLRVTSRLGRTAGFSDACFTGNTLGFRCVRRLSEQELKQLENANKTSE